MILILISMVVVTQCSWRQNGTWQSVPYKNNSFLFNFLSKNNGTAFIQGVRNNNLHVNLEGNQTSIFMKIQMRDQFYSTDVVYHMKQTKIEIKLQRKDKITFSEQQENARQIQFNLTLTHRQKLQLNSTQGDFVIQLIDLQKLHPNIDYWISQVILIVFLSTTILVILKLYIERQSGITMGLYSTFVLGMLMIKVLIQISNQLYYLPDTFQNLWLYLIIIFVVLVNYHSLTAYLWIQMKFTIEYQIDQDLVQLLLLLYFSGLFLVIYAIDLSLLCLLGIVSILQVIPLIDMNGVLYGGKQKKIAALHLVLYLFPIAIFPYYSQKINYHSRDVELWWVYIIFYVLELTLFYLKSNGQKILQLKYYLRRCRMNKGIYQQIKKNICPICFVQIELASEVNLIDDANAAGLSIESGFVLHSCNNYFHKKCIKEKGINRCFLDNMEWDKKQLKEKPLQ